MAQEVKPKNCAHLLEKPVQERQSSAFVGLRNKGATCYLNSLIQAYFNTPEFRQTILEMQLCIDNLQKRSNFVDNSNKHNFLLAFQKLFVEMQELNVSHMSTEDVTKAFGWDSDEALQQQDIQEAIRVIFDGLEKALKGTLQQDRLLDNFKIETVDKIRCLQCANTRERINVQYDLMTQIKGQSCLEESLINFQDYEKLTGGNQYFCEKCNSKQDALKGTEIRKLPNILTISLMRFEFDMVRLQRNKLNDRFSFGLELDASLFTDNQNSIYELYAVLIHKGGAHGGHYHTYLRDFQHGNSKRENPIDIIIIEDDDELPRDEQQPANMNAENINQQEKQSQMQMEIELPDPVSLHPPQQQQQQQVSNVSSQQSSAKNGQSAVQSQAMENGKKRTRRGQRGKSEMEVEEEEFPIIPSNTDLFHGWFDVDDETVRSIPSCKIQRQFGGNSDKESAYILLYRKRNLPNLVPKIPSYFEEHIASINKINQEERAHYQEEFNSIEIIARSAENLDLKTFKIIENAEPAVSYKISLTSPTSSLYKQLGLDSMYSLFEIAYCENSMIQIYQEIEYSEEKKINETDIEYNSELLFIQKETNGIDYRKLQMYAGKDNNPYMLKIVKDGVPQKDIIFHSQRTVYDLKQMLSHLFDVPFQNQYLKVILGASNSSTSLPASSSSAIPIAPDADTQTIAELQLADYSTILLSVIAETECESGGTSLTSTQRRVILERANTQPKRSVIDLSQTLEEVRSNFLKGCGITENFEKWRLKEVVTGRFFRQEDFSKPCEEILSKGTDEIRFFIEEGVIPSKDETIIIFRYFSEENQLDFSTEVLATPTTTLKEIKEKACLDLNIPASEFNVYKLDENEQPTTCVKKETQTLGNVNLRKCKVFQLVSISQSLASVAEQEFVLYFYPPDSDVDSEYVGNLFIDRNLMLEEVYELLLLNEKLKEIVAIRNLEHLPLLVLEKENIRLREVRRDHTLGPILRKSEKRFGKTISASTDILCIQIVPGKEMLEEEDLVLNVRKRNVETRTYGNRQEVIVKNAKAPTISEIKTAIIAQCGLEEGTQIEIAKHFTTKFEWKQIALNTILAYSTQAAQAKSSKKTKKKKKNSRSAVASQPTPTPTTIPPASPLPLDLNAAAKPEGTENNPVIINENSGISSTSSTTNGTYENLRKMPYCLTDGDEIGFRIQSECVNNNNGNEDDFQTEEDKENKKQFQLKKKQKNTWQNGPNADDDKGIVLNLKFDSDDEEEEIEEDDNDVMILDENELIPAGVIMNIE